MKSSRGGKVTYSVLWLIFVTWKKVKGRSCFPLEDKSKQFALLRVMVPVGEIWRT